MDLGLLVVCDVPRARSSYRQLWDGKAIRPSLPLVELKSIQVIEEVRVMDMDVLRVSADDWTILFAEFFDTPDV